MLPHSLLKRMSEINTKGKGLYVHTWIQNRKCENNNWWLTRGWKGYTYILMYYVFGFRFKIFGNDMTGSRLYSRWVGEWWEEEVYILIPAKWTEVYSSRIGFVFIQCRCEWDNRRRRLQSNKDKSVYQLFREVPLHDILLTHFWFLSWCVVKVCFILVRNHSTSILIYNKLEVTAPLYITLKGY